MTKVFVQRFGWGLYAVSVAAILLVTPTIWSRAQTNGNYSHLAIAWGSFLIGTAFIFALRYENHKETIDRMSLRTPRQNGVAFLLCLFAFDAYFGALIIALQAEKLTRAWAMSIWIIWAAIGLVMPGPEILNTEQTPFFRWIALYWRQIFLLWCVVGFLAASFLQPPGMSIILLNFLSVLVPIAWKTDFKSTK